MTAVIAAYRSNPSYLEQAVRSAIGQRDVAAHVLVSDDSHDPEIEALTASFGPNVTYRANVPPLGPALNHRVAIDLVTTEYVAILNHDDVWEPDFLSTLVAALDAHPEASVAFCDHWVVDAGGAILRAQTDDVTRRYGRDALRPGIHRDLVPLVANLTIPIAMGSVLRTGAARDAAIPTESGPSYDFWIAYALARQGGAAWYESNRLTRWRTHPDSGTAQGQPAFAAGTAFVWKQIAADPLFASVRATARARVTQARLARARAMIRRMLGPRG